MSEEKSKHSENPDEEKLLISFDLFRVGYKLMWEKVEREQPDLTDEEISSLLKKRTFERPLDGAGKLIKKNRYGT